MDNNLSRIIYEVENNLQWIATSEFNYSFLEFTKRTDKPSILARAFITNYERPAEPIQPQRERQAEFWFNFLGGVSSSNKMKWFYSKKYQIRY